MVPANPAVCIWLPQRCRELSGEFYEHESGVFHYNAGHRVRRVFAGIRAPFQVLVDFPPCDDLLRMILAFIVKPVHIVDKHLVGFLFQRIDPDHDFLQRFGMTEIGQLPEKITGFVAAADYNIQSLQRLRADRLNVIDVNPDQDFLNLIGDLIDILTEQQDIFPSMGVMNAFARRSVSICFLSSAWCSIAWIS